MAGVKAQQQCAAALAASLGRWGPGQRNAEEQGEAAEAVEAAVSNSWPITLIPVKWLYLCGCPHRYMEFL